MLHKLLSNMLQARDIRISISYFDQILGKRESQTRLVFNFTGI